MTEPRPLHHSPNHPAVRAAQRNREENLIVLPVFMDGVQVGQIMSADGYYPRFTYNQYARDNNLWISHAMKDLDGVYGGERPLDLPPFFSNLLPEGDRRDRVAESMGISADDELGLIAVMGREVIGNVQVISGNPIANREASYLEQEIDSVFSGDLFLESSDVNSPNFDVFSLPGVQWKVSHFASKLRASHEKIDPDVELLPLLILKLETPGLGHIVSNEGFFMRLSREAGLNPAEHFMLSGSNGEKCLLVQRFDRRLVDDELVRIPVEDACQLLSQHPRERHGFTYKEVCRAVKSVVDDPARASEELFRAYVYSYAIGNGDLHAKNISVWKNPENGETELTPAYDILCSFVYGERGMVLPIDKNQKGDTISAEMLEELGLHLGLSDDSIKKIAGGVAVAVRKGLEKLDEIEFDSYRHKECLKVLTGRMREIDKLAGRDLQSDTSPKLDM